VLGAGLLVAAVVTGFPLAAMGHAVVVVTCAYGLRLSIISHDTALREAFRLGRDHEWAQSIRSR
jgi:hypothetical protein